MSDEGAESSVRDQPRHDNFKKYISPGMFYAG